MATQFSLYFLPFSTMLELVVSTNVEASSLQGFGENRTEVNGRPPNLLRYF
jgi:hypothetical protein